MEEMRAREREADVRAIRRAVLEVAGARTLMLTEAQRERIANCDDLAQLESWLAHLATANTADSVFD